MPENLFDQQNDDAARDEAVPVIDYQRELAEWDANRNQAVPVVERQNVYNDEEREEPVQVVDYQSESPDETSRCGGLAWSAGIVFFSSIAFTLFLGWIADWLLGSSPWGLVGGIVLGSIIGFVQFFRITSQIFSPNKTGPAERPLMPHDDDDD